MTVLGAGPRGCGLLALVGVLALPVARDTASVPQAVPPWGLTVRGLFAVYQKGAGPTKGVSCPMRPSCSEFGRLAWQKHSVPRAMLMTVDRLHRCGHDRRYYPVIVDRNGTWSWDPVPERHTTTAPR